MSNVSPIFFDVGSLEEEDRRLVTLGAMHPFRIAMDPLTMTIEEDIQVKYLSTGRSCYLLAILD